MKKLILISTAILAVLTIVNGAYAVANTAFTLDGYNGNQGGSNPSWTSGNLGGTYDEGEFVPYKLVVTNVQTSFPNFAGFPKIVLSGDFFSSTKDAKLIDLYRDIQIGTVDLTDSQGFPIAGGGAQPTTVAGIEAGQNDPQEHTFSGYRFFNLPNTQVNTKPDGTMDIAPGNATHSITITPKNITDALNASGIPLNTSTIVIYFQAHEARTFVWLHSLQSAYASNPTTSAWGGYLYATDGWPTDTEFGAGFFPGSSGHMVANFGIGAKSVPIPIPVAPSGSISGHKFYDNPPIGTINSADTPLSGWRIFINGSFPSEPIVFVNSTLTDNNGAYQFNDLAAASFIISEASQREVPSQSGYQETYPTSSTPNSTPISIPNNGSEGYNITLTAAAPTATNIDFGNIRNGTIIVVKNTVGGDGQFNFTTGGGDGFPASFNITTSGFTGNQTFNVTAGNYNISEVVPEGWKLESSSCTGAGNSPSNFAVPPGETVTCTFNNSKLATIIVVKNTIGGDDIFNYTTTGGDNLPQNFSIQTSGGTGNQTFNNIDPDVSSYGVFENVTAGWALNSNTTSTGQPTSAFTVAPGSTVYVNFTNGKLHLSFIKQGALDFSGQTTNYTINVTNDGFGNLTIVNMTDPNTGKQLSCPQLPIPLVPGQSTGNCTATYSGLDLTAIINVITQIEIDIGQLKHVFWNV